ncbi:energy transducer TonB [uncultured Fibrella sp.]|uniref:energy transducer TonB n=1 Tax=uncultured Fibrella sp. TaxID=1284596 RepID=UPI0035CC94E4
MRLYLHILLLLLSVSLSQLHAQAPVYKPFDVDSVATPIGGQAMLETFLAANLQKPFMAKVANVTGKVFLTAVVEPDGHVSDVQVMRGLRSDCDQEALRVMRLFNAWKPATKSGQPVRQLVTYPIMFRANTPIRYENGSLIEEFDAKFTPIANSLWGAKPVYQQHTPIDTLTGLPSGKLTLFEIKESGKLKEVAKVPLARVANAQRQNGELTYQFGHKEPTGDWIGAIYTLREDGSISQRTSSDLMKGPSVSYDKRGMVESTTLPDEAGTTTWQPNGLLLKIETRYEGERKALHQHTQLMAAWDSTGKQLIKEGNGHYRYVSSQESRSDSTRKTTFIEEGDYKDGFKNGQWTGRLADGSYSYIERYDAGEDLGGMATLLGGKTISYKQSMSNPSYNGGQSAMYQFLGQTIRYPIDAQKKNVSGKVYISFVVCTDGSLCDYDVLKGIYPSVDAEALRTVKKMPSWQPGLLRGEPVRVKYNLPVSFQLE